MKLTINLTVPTILIILQRATSLSTSSNIDMHVKSLHRYAVKGLSGDSMQSVILNESDGTFEDDRRFALLFDNSEGAQNFDENDPKWLHKDNFLCAFTASQLLATLRTEYKVEPDSGKRLLSVWNRNDSESNSDGLLLLADLASQAGRYETSGFFSELCGKKVVCICASDNRKSSTSQNEVDDNGKSDAPRLGGTHTHQFGNTSSGVKNNNGDTRTIHIVNSNTVKEFSDAIQQELVQQYKMNKSKSDETDETGSIQLNPTRFRPNVIVDGLDPWREFDLIGKTIEVIPKQDSKDAIEMKMKSTPLRFRITSRTVRCAGIGVDPLQPEVGTLDIPKLLTKHFPQHGPYLGVYAVVEKDDDYNGGEIQVGDTFRVLEE